MTCPNTVYGLDTQFHSDYWELHLFSQVCHPTAQTLQFINHGLTQAFLDREEPFSLVHVSRFE